MKSIITLIILVVFLLTPLGSPHAQSNVSQFVNFQGVLVDEGGNVLYDIQQADVRCSVIDGAGAVLYEEIQPDTALINGAISILCGNGINPNTGAVTGGIPYDVFSPEGSRLLRVQVNDDIPQEEVEIVSVPYSYYSQLALGLANPLEADDITAGVITRTHLHDDLWNQIVELGFGEGALNAHRTESGAHHAISISVENTLFVNTPGTNLQEVLQGLDNAISTRGNVGEVLDNRLTQEVSDREVAITSEQTAREAADAAETTARTAADTTLQSNIDVERSAREAADAAETAAREAAITAEQTARETADNAERSARETADVAHAGTNIDAAHPGNFPTNRLSGQITNGQIANNAVTSDKISDGSVTSADIQNGTITTSDMASTNISQWSNDSGYITDGNTDWDNTYGFITDGNAGWDNSYGFITAADVQLYDFTGWDTNASDDLTSSTNFGGDVSGTYGSLQLGSGVVGSTEIASSAVGPSEIAANAVDADEVENDSLGLQELKHSIIQGEISCVALGSPMHVLLEQHCQDPPDTVYDIKSMNPPVSYLPIVWVDMNGTNDHFHLGGSTTLNFVDGTSTPSFSRISGPLSYKIEIIHAQRDYDSGSDEVCIYTVLRIDGGCSYSDSTEVPKIVYKVYKIFES